MKNIKINNKNIGDSNPTFIIAEIGANHNNNVEDIKKIIRAAKNSGVDAIKFQTYTADELLADGDRIIRWGIGENSKSESIKEMFDSLSLSRKIHKQIFDYAEELGLIVFSTPFSVEGVKFLDSLGVPCFKIASSDVNYVDMLVEIAKTKKPVMLSIGKCTLSDADKAINLLQENGCEDLIIMHCVAQYPAPINEMNINIIKSLKSMYPECVVGFSDHSLGITASIGAVALGAKVVEKHFTIDKELEGPDHWFSMDENEMRSLVNEVRNLEMALGSSRKRVLPCEEEERKNSIRSLVINRNIKIGEVVREDDLAMLRPGWGISPFDKEKVIGMRIMKNLNAGTVLKWEYFK